MRKLFLASTSAFAILSSVSAFADGLSAPPVMGSGVSAGLKNAANANGGAVLLNGLPTSGDLLQWSATGAQDSGVATSNIPLLSAGNTFTAAQTIQGGQYNGIYIKNGTVTAASFLGYSSTGDDGALRLFHSGGAQVSISANNATVGNYFLPAVSFGSSVTATYPVDVTGYARVTSGLIINGSSTGLDTIASGNTSATSRTLSTPAGTANDTLALLGANQTFSGNDIHSGSVLFTGAPTTFTANGQVQILGGTTAPTFNASNMNTIAIGGYYASSSAPGLTSGGGNIFMTSNGNGLGIQAGTVSLLGPTGSVVAKTTYQGLFATNYYNATSGRLLSSSTAPTFSGATVGTHNGTLAFTFVPTASGTSVTITMPAASTGWVCQFTDLTTPAQQVRQTGALSTTSVTASAYTWAGAAGSFGTSDTVTAMCAGI